MSGFDGVEIQSRSERPLTRRSSLGLAGGIIRQLPYVIVREGLDNVCHRSIITGPGIALIFPHCLEQVILTLTGTIEPRLTWAVFGVAVLVAISAVVLGM